MRITWILFFIIAISIPDRNNVCFTQIPSFKIIDDSIRHSYIYSICVSQGPLAELSSGLNDTTIYRSFRIVIDGSSIYKDRFRGDRISIEEFTIGPEGCCKRLAQTRDVNLHRLMEKYRINHEIFGLEFKRWISATSFEFKLYKNIFRVSNLDKSELHIIKVR